VNPRNFFAELKRRNVYKVAIAYAVVAWLLTQIATQVFPFLEIPNWAIRLVIMLIVIGFPIALVIAWAFELTPEGLKRTEFADELPKKSARNRVWIYVVVTAGAISVGVFFLGRYTSSKQSAELPEKSIAVLPLVNESGDASQDYFSDGLTEELITGLGQIRQLRVIGRNSSFQFKGKAQDSRTIGQVLGVANLLEGSVRKVADRVRVAVQLVRATDGSQLWSQSYDRELKDILAVQEEIAKEISEKLRLRLTGAEQQQLAKRPTENIKAFQYYMQGRTYRQRSTREDLLTAVRYCQKAIDEDRNYALAYTGLADAYATLGVYGYIAPIEGRRQGEEGARKALALDANLAEAHVALGQACVAFAPSDFPLGDRELRHAVELSPSLASAHFFLGVSLVRQGRLDESLEEYLKARELDPLSSIIARQFAIPYYFKRDYARARELLRQANELGPALSTTWEIGVYIQNKLFGEALAELENAKRERKNDSILIYDAGMVYAAQGKRAEALQIIKELEEMSGASLSQAHWIAKIYATLNEKEQALSWLERGLATGAIGSFYKDEPMWDPIRSDPRFEALVEKMFVPPKTPADARGSMNRQGEPFFGARDATIFSKRGSPRSGSQNGSSFNLP
jgi:TolB-like protein/Flp pilus assembly protein TadD